MFKRMATLVCAAAMAVSAFTGVVANAAVERDQGVNLVAAKSGDDKVKLDVYAVGYSTVANYALKFLVSGATLTGVTADYSALGGDYNAVFISGSRFNSVAADTSAVTLTDNRILTLTLTFSEAISNDITITLTDDGNGSIVGPVENEDTLDYYEEDLESNPDWVTLGFNDAVVKAAPAKVPAAVTAVDKQPQITGTGEYEAQTADIYGVEIKPNDESVSGAKVSVGGQQKDINFKTVCSGSGTVVFAVILASETGAELPELSADNVTPIVAVD